MVEPAELEPAAPLSEAAEAADPRIRRSRELLQQALATLLEEKNFEAISVQDIAAAATVNRATFYAHYPDKFALLECLVAGRFHALLAARGIAYDGACLAAVHALALGLCDFLAYTHTLDTRPDQTGPSRQLEPHMENAIVSVVRKIFLAGMRRRNEADAVPLPADPVDPITPELRAAAVSWALYGAAREWVRTPERPSSEAMAEALVGLIAPLLHPSATTS